MTQGLNQSLKSPVLPGGFFTRRATWEAQLESSLPNTLTAKYLWVSSCSVSFFFFLIIYFWMWWVFVAAWPFL